MANPSKAPEPLSAVLLKIMDSMQSESNLTHEQIHEVWTRIAGEEAASHSWPKQIHKQCLVVEVENSGWIYALNLKKAQLLEGLIEFLGAGTIRQLAFRIGEAKNG